MRIVQFCVLLLVGLLIAPSVSSAQRVVKEEERVHTVVYSYQKWSRQLPARYALVATPAIIKQASLADRAPPRADVFRHG